MLRSMKSLPLLAALVCSSLFFTPQAHAKKVGKLAGNYTGSGTFIDKTNAPVSTYKFIFSDLVLKVSSSGKINGSATVTAQISSNGSPYLPIGSQPVTGSGKVTDVEVTKSKITATGTMKFSDGSEVHGTFSVAAKTGKGTFKVKVSNSQYDVNFKASKKK